MDDADSYARLTKVISELEASMDDQRTDRFMQLFEELKTIAKTGIPEAATFLAEIMAFPGPNHDAENAYTWFYVGLSQDGYLVEFDDQNHTPPHYCGPVGDFRNESLVNDLVAILGFRRTQELDKEAAKLIREIADRK